jgi:hypothetical protein
MDVDVEGQTQADGMANVDNRNNDDSDSSEDENSGIQPDTEPEHQCPGNSAPAETAEDEGGAPSSVYDASCRLHDPPVISKFPGEAGKVHGVETLTGNEAAGEPGEIY